MNTETINSLLHQKHFPDLPQTVELIETHASWVILTEHYAYKIKKPLIFSFLDFSTLEKRKYYCEQEYLLNNRLAPEMYLGILPLREEGDRIKVGEGPGQIIDYAVFMKRMDYSRQMDVLLKKGEVEEKNVVDIAVQVARFHQRVKAFKGNEQVEQIHARFADVATVSDFMKRYFGRQAEQLVEELVDYSAAFTSQYAFRFQERAKSGFVIDGHGDLHSRNIFLLDRAVIFDCIEFNDDYRRLDVLSDIAFFCMDLDQYQRTDLVDCFLEAYLHENPCISDEIDRQIFHYYKMYRANVRLKVNILAAVQFEKQNCLPKSKLKEVEVYYLLLKRYFSERKMLARTTSL